MKLKSIVFAVAAGVLAAASTVALAGKVGVVNPERILRESSIAAQSEQTLRKEFASRQEAIKQAANRFKAKVEDYQKKSAKMSEEARAKAERDLASEERTLQRRDRELREDLNRRRNEELQGILTKANGVIARIAKAEGYDLIVQEAVWMDPAVDITDKVLKALEGKHK